MLAIDSLGYLHEKLQTFLNNGNRTERSPIRSVIIHMINKIGQPKSGSPICSITSMITGRKAQSFVIN